MRKDPAVWLLHLARLLAVELDGISPANVSNKVRHVQECGALFNLMHVAMLPGNLTSSP
jgi:hypothetical protein